jgi:polynucleotide 5'-hydroxyl-kinase GRC3/NOL9
MTIDLPPAWAHLIASLVAEPWKRVVVIGGTDAGKSSFARLLCQSMARPGLRTALLDTDLGQKMIGPPACVTLARCSADGELQLERIRFVGEASPAANLTGTIAATARLANAADADRLVVNTSGLITGPGIPLKRWKLDALDPEHVVAIARGDELAPLLGALPPGRVHQLRPSPAAQRKSPSLRERNRVATLMAALGECRPVALPGLVIEDLHRSPPPPDTLRLGGLADASGEDRALALVRWSDYLQRAEIWVGPIGFTPHRLRLGMKLADFGDVPGPFMKATMSKSLPRPSEV